MAETDAPVDDAAALEDAPGDGPDRARDTSGARTSDSGVGDEAAEELDAAARVAAPGEASGPQGEEDDDGPMAGRLVLPGGPVAAIGLEAAAAAGAGLWQLGGWPAVAAGAAGVGAAGAAAWSAGRSRRGGAAGGGGRVRWLSARSPIPAARRGGGRAGAARVPRVGGPGGGRRAGVPRGAAGRGTVRGSGRAASRRAGGAAVRSAARMPAAWRSATASRSARAAGGTARRAAKAAGRGADRAAAAAGRGYRAASAARRAARDGGTARSASRAARAALRDAHKTTQVRGAWRRMAGSAAWSVAGWGIGLLHLWGRQAFGALRYLFRVRHPSQDTSSAGQDRPRINTTVNRPTGPAAGGYHGGADTMAKRGGGVPQFVHTAQQLGEDLRRYDPPPGANGMIEMFGDMSMLPDAIEHIAVGLNALADRCRNQLPLHPAISEFVFQMAKAQAQIATLAEEIRPAIERLHEPELTRHRAPRPGEDRWNVA